MSTIIRPPGHLSKQEAAAWVGILRNRALLPE